MRSHAILNEPNRLSYFQPLLVLLVTAATISSAAAQAEWPQFLGPNADLTICGATLPTEWSETENIVWKTPIHDAGWSSPVVANGQIWLTSANEDGTKMYAVCVDAESGRVIHDILLFDDQKPTDELLINTFASPTPVIDQRRVYVHFGTYGTACLDTVTGQVIWQRRDLNCDHLRGPGSSPFLHGDLLYLTFDGADCQFTAALNKTTGKTVWQKKRSTDFGEMDGDLRKSYCTPIVIEVDGKEQLVSVGAQAAFAYDPLTGDELWSVRYKGYSNASRPLFDGKRLYLNTGFGRAQLWAIRPDGHGDITDTHVDWKVIKAVPLKPTSVLCDGLIYMPGDKGILCCITAESGEMLWQERLGGAFSASPLLAMPGDEGDAALIYFPDEEGKTTVIRVGSSPEEKEECEIIAVNELDDGCMASPAVVGNALILRTKSALYRIEKP